MKNAKNGLALALIAACGLTSAAWAQPAVDEDLGTITENTPVTITRTVTFDSATNPVQWYQIVLPTVANPNAFLDMFTYSATGTDTEIGLYRADGTLVDSDDDDGAATFSALSYGSNNTAFPTRVNPTQNGAQTAGVASNGRDGAADITAGTYYIAVSKFNATFAAGFTVTTTGTGTNTFDFDIRYNGIAPTNPFINSVAVSPTTGEVGTNVVVTASVTPGANPISSVSVDASAIDGGTVSMNDSGVAPDITAGDGNWSGSVTVGANTGLGAQTLVVTATDSGALTASGNATLTVLPSAPGCPSGNRTASFTNMISTAAVSTAIPPAVQPGDTLTNTIVQSTQSGAGVATAMRISGRYIEVNAGDLQTENRIRIVAPSGNAYTFTPFPTGGDTTPRDLTNFLATFTTAETIAGDWYFESGQSFNDANEDGHWSSICFAWANPPVGTPVTPITAFAGSALPGFGSSADFSISVAGGTGPYTVTVDGGAAGIGTINLTDGDNDGSYTASVPAANFTGPGTYTLPYLITDATNETFGGNIVVNIRRGVTDLGTVSTSNMGTLVSGATLNTGEILWFKFNTCVDTTAPSWFDVVTSGVISGGTNPNDTEVGFYRADGTMLANDDDDGVLAGSALSFGAGSGLQQGGTGTLDTGPVLSNGRDGAATLTAGEYYMAIGHFNVTFNATNFNVTTTGLGSGTVDATFDTDQTCGPVCNDIDFNNDGSFFDPQDIDAFLSVYSEGPCIPDTQVCDDIDFNNDTSIFDPCDINSFLLVYSEGPCELCPL